MGFRKFYLHTILVIIIIAGTCLGITYLYWIGDYWITLYNLIFLLLLEIVYLVNYLTRWRRDFISFADSVKSDDYTINFKKNENRKDFWPLYETLNKINDYVRELKAIKEEQSHYLKYVVENARVGLIAFDKNGKVLIKNEEVAKVTGSKSFKNVNELATKIEWFKDIWGFKLNHPYLISVPGQKIQKLSVRLSKMIIEKEDIYLLSILDIKNELEENELRTWQDLISVLTHEIMNSISPIHSLNGSMAKYLEKISGNEEVIEKAKQNLVIIERRSQALMDFVERYRKLSTVPLPKIDGLDIEEVINGILGLLEEELKDVEVKLNLQVPVIWADNVQIEQVLINLIKNAVYSMDENSEKELVISSEKSEDGTKDKLAIKDIGKGIEPDLMDKIFIPFFTTRKEGSGIGLTLSRQIMQKHGGSIEVESQVGEGSTFTLVFPAGK